jgi:ribosomal protein S18 acetylase RimI-like enzyme
MDILYTVRPFAGTMAEAEVLLGVQQRALGERVYTVAQALALLERPSHLTQVAAWGQEIVGFCSCFVTATGAGARLELDLLGVAAGHRGRGLATQLVAHSVAAARERGLRRARTIVAAGNVASQRAFQRAGLRSSASATPLLVCRVGSVDAPPKPAPWVLEVREDAAGREEYRLFRESKAGAYGHTPLPLATAVGLRVETLSYRGLWLEELAASTPEATTVLAQAVAARARELGLDLVGHHAAAARDTALACAFGAARYVVAGYYYTMTVGEA